MENAAGSSAVSLCTFHETAVTDSSGRFLDALYHAVDGNFRSNQRGKPMDPNDLPLSLGAAYFTNEDEFSIYQQTIKPGEQEVGTPSLITVLYF